MVLPEKRIAALSGKPFVILDDVVRKGKALKALAELCQKHNMKPVSIISAINGGLQNINGIHIASLLQHPMRQWKDELTCKLCQEGVIPLHDPYFFDRG
jgi:orotate phosphoribosyltransferase